jgi:hypothetical protein
LWVAAALALCAFDGHAQKRTVCTITVNSADERDAFRKYLPEDEYDFVELVERGRSDWLASSCRKGVQCDVLVVSGHFAGTEFYSSRLDVNESLPVDEIERAQCSDSCPGLFSKLREVYLFGCDTLKPEPVKSASPEIVRGLVRSGMSKSDAEGLARALSVRYGESSRDLMRRLFPDVAVIYGFSSLAPYGRVAGPMLERYFESESGDEVGRGYPSESLLRLFGPSSMTVASGMTQEDPDFDFRAQMCRYHDDRQTPAQKLAFVHRTMGGEMAEVRMSFDRVEKFFAALTEAQRRDPAFAQAIDAMAGDRATRRRYLDLVRATEDPALRVRMIALARTVGWLKAPEQRAEIVRMIVDMLAGSNVGYGEVDLICTLNKDRELAEEIAQFKVARLPAKRTADAAALACLGSAKARTAVLKALASRDEEDVQIAQSYLRHHPMDHDELRKVASGVARMKGSAAQVRALETLARHQIADPEILAELTRLYTRATSVSVQRAIAEIFIRSDYRGTSSTVLAGLLRQHRLSSPGGEDLIDVLLVRLQQL